MKEKSISLKFYFSTRAGRLSTQLILIYGDSSWNGNRAVVVLQKQALFWANECLLIKNMTFIIYQKRHCTASLPFAIINLHKKLLFFRSLLGRKQMELSPC